MQKDNIEETPQEVHENKYWQWVKGEKSGDVVTIKNIDDKWINFNEGGRLSKDLQNEFIQQLDADIAGEFVKPQMLINDPLNVSASPKKIQEVVIPKKEISPIRVLFNKQKKNNKVKLLLEFPVNIPTKGVYELMSTSFDKKEVNEQLESFILDQLSEDEILDCLHNSVKSLIESKYKGE
tara:strand:- start:36 stop:575 length:540 start_codon:yes stop_codon:yes gene_type:complete